MRLLGLFLFLFSQWSMAGVIEFKSSLVVAPNSSLTLMDLVDSKESAAIGEIEKKLSKTTILQVQDAGERVGLSLQSVAGHLKLALSPEERERFKFSIPRRIEIHVEAPKLTEEYVTQRLIHEWQTLCEPCKIQILDLRLPIGKFAHWKLDIPKNIPKGSFNLAMDVKTTDGERRYWVQGRLDVLKEVPVAQRALYVGERVQAEDFKYQWRSVTHATDGVPARNLIIGSQIKLPISADSVIWSRHLAKEKALRRGDQVRVYSSGRFWEMSLPAVAEGDAEVGDTVTLKNPKTNKKLVGLVVGKGEVEVK